MVKTIQAMKKIDEIKARRQQRFFDRRMAKAEAKKKLDVERELMKHSDLITDSKVKSYIQKKKQEATKKDLAKFQANNKPVSMDVNEDMIESEEEKVV